MSYYLKKKKVMSAEPEEPFGIKVEFNDVRYLIGVKPLSFTPRFDFLPSRFVISLDNYTINISLIHGEDGWKSDNEDHVPEKLIQSVGEKILEHYQEILLLV